MKEPRKRKGWIFFGLGCFALGAAVMDLVRNGTAAVLLSVSIIFGKYLMGKIMGVFFDGELAAFKKQFQIKDPIKRQIWRHAHDHHGGKFKNCRRPECAL